MAAPPLLAEALVPQLSEALPGGAAAHLRLARQAPHRRGLGAVVRGQVAVQLAAGGHEVAAQALEHRLSLHTVGLKVILKVGSLSGDFEANGTVMARVVIKRHTLHAFVSFNVYDGRSLLIIPCLRVSSL